MARQIAIANPARHGRKVPGHRYLQYIGHNGFIGVRMAVPPALRPIIGKPDFYKALNTDSLTEADRRKHAVIAEFQAQIEAAWVESGKPARRFVMSLPFMPQSLATAIVAARNIGADTLQIGNPAELPVAEPMQLAGFTYEAGLALWVSSQGSEAPGEAGQSVYHSHLSRFFKHLGHDEMGRVSEDDIIAYPSVLLTGSDGGSKPRRKLGNKAVNNNMASIRAVFRVAKFHRKIASDPTVGTIKKLPVAKSGRKGFDREQAAQIIAEALKLPESDPRRWLWLIGCHSGARIGELADATVSAVREIGGHWCFDINEDHRCHHNGKPLPLKTEGSARPVPLHNAVLSAGFLAYVDSIRAEHGDNAPLFPMFSLNRFGKRSDTASRLCLEWLREVVGIYAGPNVYVFHSTRHAIKTYLRSARVEEEMHDAITGHIEGGVGRDYGEYEIAAMAEAIEKLRLAA